MRIALLTATLAGCVVLGLVAAGLVFEDQCVPAPAWAGASQGPAIAWWPPGLECTYTGGDRAPLVVHDSGTLIAFMLAWACGTGAVLYAVARRSLRRSR